MEKSAKRVMILSLAAFVLLFAGSAQAGLSLDKVIIKFTPDNRPVKNVSITNSGDVPLKVTTSIVHVLNPGQDNVAEEETKTLSVAPKIFELEPGEQRLVRMVLRKFPDEKEEIYRVRFTPDKATRTEEKQSGGTSVKIQIITSMGVLVMAAPKVPQPDLRFSRKPGFITFQNNGNVTAHLQRDEYCLSDGCIPLSGKRIYPGASWVMDIPEKLQGMSFTQTVLMDENYTTLSFPPP